jgi:hypothetical protein
VSTRFDALIPIGVTLEQILKPAFWAHHAVKLKPMDEIRARAEDGTWLAYLVVLDCSRTWAKVAAPLHAPPHHARRLAQTQASLQEQKAFIAAHKVVHRGPHKWSVVRKADNAVLEQGIEQKDAAEKWLEKHAREQASAAPAAKPEPAGLTAEPWPTPGSRISTAATSRSSRSAVRASRTC